MNTTLDKTRLGQPSEPKAQVRAANSSGPKISHLKPALAPEDGTILWADNNFD